MIYVLTVVRNRIVTTRKFIKKINNQKCKIEEIVVVDDGSTDGTLEFLTKENVKILKGDGNLWWTGGVNFGLSYIFPKTNTGDFIFIANDDIKIKSNFIEKLVAESKKNHRAIVSAISKNKFGKVLRTGVKYEWKPFKVKAEENNPDAFSTRSTIIPVEVFSKIGLFDQKNFPHYTSDFDFFLRAKQAGFSLKLIKDAFVVTNDSPRIKSKTSIKSAGNIYNWTRFLWKHSPGYFWKFINIGREWLSLLVN